MLILTRQISESVIIDEKIRIKVTILGVKGKRVNLGIDAPKNISIHREEIQQRIDKEARNEHHHERSNNCEKTTKNRMYFNTLASLVSAFKKNCAAIYWYYSKKLREI